MSNTPTRRDYRGAFRAQALGLEPGRIERIPEWLREFSCQLLADDVLEASQ